MHPNSTRQIVVFALLISVAAAGIYLTLYRNEFEILSNDVEDNKLTRSGFVSSSPKPPSAHHPPPGWTIYQDHMSGLSFFHPGGWECTSYRTVSGRHDRQITCNDAHFTEDSFVVISIPGVAEDHDLWTKVGESILPNPGGLDIVRSTYLSHVNPKMGIVEYDLTGPSEQMSISMFATFSLSSPFKTQEATEATLDDIAYTIWLRG